MRLYGKRQDKAGRWRLAKVLQYSSNSLDAYLIENEWHSLGVWIDTRIFWLLVQRYQPLQLDLPGTRRPYIRTGHLSSIVEIKRIRGVIFNNKAEAEQHGLQLYKDWIDKQPWRSRRSWISMWGVIRFSRTSLDSVHWVELYVRHRSEGPGHESI
jgi:hypothetical protein